MDKKYLEKLITELGDEYDTLEAARAEAAEQATKYSRCKDEVSELLTCARRLLYWVEREYKP